MVTEPLALSNPQVLLDLIAAAGRTGEQDADLLEHARECLVHLLKYRAKCHAQTSLTLCIYLGPPVVPFYPFWGEGSPTKIDHTKKGYPYSSLSTGGPRYIYIYMYIFALPT